MFSLLSNKPHRSFSAIVTQIVTVHPVLINIVIFQIQDLIFAIFEHHDAVFPGCLVLFKQQPCNSVYQLLLYSSAFGIIHILLRVFFVPLSRMLIRILNSISPRRVALVIAPQLNFVLMFTAF